MRGKILTTIALLGALALGSGCSSPPEIRDVKDVTGDGRDDIMLYHDAFYGEQRGRYLFIGKPDGTFIRTQEKIDRNKNSYFISDDKEIWFDDGEKYVNSPRKEKK